MAGGVFGIPMQLWTAVVEPFLSFRDLLTLRCANSALKRGVDGSLDTYQRRIQWEIDLIASDPFLRATHEEISALSFQAKGFIYQLSLMDVSILFHYRIPPLSVQVCLDVIFLLLTDKAVDDSYAQFRRMKTIIVRDLAEFSMMSASVTNNAAVFESFVENNSAEQFAMCTNFSGIIYQYFACVVKIAKLRESVYDSCENRRRMLIEERGKVEKFVQRYIEAVNS